jgi:Holliday junction resolvase RusA-like endonuclease
MNDNIQFFVSGKPITQGSMTSFGKGRMVHQNYAKLHGWRTEIAKQFEYALKERGSGWDTDKKYEVRLSFFFNPPKKPKNDYPRGDLDKLCRAVLDALTTHAWDDDNQVIRFSDCSKEYHPAEGVWVTILAH